MPRQRRLFRIEGRAAGGSARCRGGHPQPRQITQIPRHDLRRREAAKPILLRSWWPHPLLAALERGLAPGRGDRANRQAGSGRQRRFNGDVLPRSEEHTSELQSLMRISYAVFCLKKKNRDHNHTQVETYNTTTYV